MMAYKTYIGLGGETATIPLEGMCEFELSFDGPKHPRMKLSFILTERDRDRIDELLERCPTDSELISVLIKFGEHVKFDGDACFEFDDNGETGEATPAQHLRPILVQ